MGHCNGFLIVFSKYCMFKAIRMHYSNFCCLNYSYRYFFRIYGISHCVRLQREAVLRPRVVKVQRHFVERWVKGGRVLCPALVGEGHRGQGGAGGVVSLGGLGE